MNCLCLMTRSEKQTKEKEKKNMKNPFSMKKKFQLDPRKIEWKKAFTWDLIRNKTNSMKKFPPNNCFLIFPILYTEVA